MVEDQDLDLVLEEGEAITSAIQHVFMIPGQLVQHICLVPAEGPWEKVSSNAVVINNF